MEDSQEFMKKLEAAGQMRLPLDVDGGSSNRLECSNAMREALHQHAIRENAACLTSVESAGNTAPQGREDERQGSLLADLFA